jgi:leucine-zipper of insertion element IS481
VYLSEGDVQLLRAEPPYVRKRYRAVSRTLAPDLVRITREDAASLIGRSKRQMQRIVKRFKEEGIQGLRFRSKRPHTEPRNKTPADIERRVVEVRNATGFGSEQLATIVNEGLRLESRGPITDTTCYNILARNDLVEAERRVMKRYKTFEWGHPDELIQCDLTEFNGYPILTMEDDHSREGWAGSIENATDDMVVDGMIRLHPDVFENLLTDNGKQFARMNSTMRRYCEEHTTGKHIWSTIHHPQTLGKLSAFQKDMKRFLIHRLGRSTNKDAIDECISTYVDWHNNGLKVRTIRCSPEERYSGRKDPRWYQRLVKALNLDRILPTPAQGG